MENEEVIRLLETKSFDDLNAEERQLVLTHMSEEAYEEERAVIMQARELFDEEAAILVPDPSIKHNVRAAIQREEATSIWVIWFGWLNHRVPTYGVLVPAILAGALIIWLWPEREVVKQYSVQADPQIVEGPTVYDTIYLEREVPKEVVVEKVKVVKVPGVAPAPAPKPQVRVVPVNDGALAFANNPTGDVGSASSLVDSQKNRIGQSAEDNQELNQFRTGFN